MPSNCTLTQLLPSSASLPLLCQLACKYSQITVHHSMDLLQVLANVWRIQIIMNLITQYGLYGLVLVLG